MNGDRSLAQQPLWGSGGFTVQERGSLAVNYVTFDASVSLTVAGGGSLSLASMAVPAAILTVMVSELSGAGSRLRLTAVTVLDCPVGEQTGTVTVGADGLKTAEPPNLYGTGTFTVVSGCSAGTVDWSVSPPDFTCTDNTPPCTVSDGGRCVGRAGGYLGSESCAITVGGGGGALGACGVFDMEPYQNNDHVTMPGGSMHSGDIHSVMDAGRSVDVHYGSDCPVGAVLSPGDSVGWASDGVQQGNSGNGEGFDNGCAANGLCGLPESRYGLGGGWQICFA